MNKRIQKLVKQATRIEKSGGLFAREVFDKEKFAELIVAQVLDEVAERAYYSGDRAWSDELDRCWVELEFGIGELAELKK